MTFEKQPDQNKNTITLFNSLNIYMIKNMMESNKKAEWKIIFYLIF